MRCRQTQTRVCVLQDLPIAKKIRDGIGELGAKRLLPITKRRQFDRGTLRPSTYTQRSVAGALRLKFFIFLSVVPRGGQFHSRRESSRRTTHGVLRVPVDCLTGYLITIIVLLLRLPRGLLLQPTTLPLTCNHQ